MTMAYAKKQIKHLSGRLIYIICWPMLWLYLFRSRRSRIAIFADHRLLVVKPTLSNGKWQLPGGGVKKNESFLDGVIRELYEETGLKLKAEYITCINHQKVIINGFYYDRWLYITEVQGTAPIRLHNLEIEEAEWVLIDDLNSKNSDKDVLSIIDGQVKRVL